MKATGQPLDPLEDVLAFFRMGRSELASLLLRAEIPCASNARFGNFRSSAAVKVVIFSLSVDDSDVATADIHQGIENLTV